MYRAEHFDVTLQFLLQQAAWLYDRQLSQVRAQMRKVPPVQSSSPSPAAGSVSGSTALSGHTPKGNVTAGMFPCSVDLISGSSCLQDLAPLLGRSLIRKIFLNKVIKSHHELLPSQAYNIYSSQRPPHKLYVHDYCQPSPPLSRLFS